MIASRSLLVGAAFGAGALVGRASASPQVRFARMTGSSIAAPDAAGWVTDFLNAAYYRRAPDHRDVDDLRLASAIVTTRWHRLGHRRLRLGDVVPFHSAFGRDRFVDGARSAARDARSRAAARRAPRGSSAPGSPTRTPTTSAAAGASRSSPPRARGVRPGGAPARRASAPHAADAPGREQTWHTYPPVRGAVGRRRNRRAVAPGDLARLRQRGRALHAGAARRAGRADVRDRGRRRRRRRAARLHARLRDDHDAGEPRGPGRAARYVDELNDGLARFGRDEPPAGRRGRRRRCSPST